MTIMSTGQKLTCPQCKKKFVPDPRNAHHQKYCTRPACRKASRKHSQEKWLAKNPDVFKGPENVMRVQIWRQEKGHGRGRMIYKLVLEFMIFRRRGRKDRIEVTKKDGDGLMLQDFIELRNAIKTRVILRLVKVLQDFTDLLLPEAYSPNQKGKKARRRGRKKCQKKKTVRQACLRKSRSSATRR